MMKDKALEVFTRMDFDAQMLAKLEDDPALKLILDEFSFHIKRMKEVVRKISRTECEEENENI